MLFLIFIFWPHFAACGILAPWSGSSLHWKVEDRQGSPKFGYMLSLIIV